MLTSLGYGEANFRAEEVGLVACLTKPVRQSQLLDTILLCLSDALPSGEKEPEAKGGAGLPDAPRSGLRVLLAEDNLINQKVALRVLERRFRSVELASDGHEAVALHQATPFDLILMDCQMPEMSGYEATQVIRKWEEENGGRVPIIAMTANAMKGDRERCLQAGMDDYVSKPIQVDILFATLDKWISE